MSDKFNTVVIGAGPGGYVAALRLAALKQRVALVEASYLGGTCLNVGCIPTKALLHTSEIAALIAHGKEHGIIVDKPRIDIAAMMQRKNAVVKKLTGGVAALLKARRVEIFMGRATLRDPHRIDVAFNDGGAETLQTENIIIATGSEPIVPSIFPQDRTKVMTSDEILALQQQPESLLIVGGGYIGCEFATIFIELGTAVTVVEMLDRLLPMADPDVSKSIQKTLQAQGVKTHTATAVENMKINAGKVNTTLQNGQTIITDLALVCTGRRPLTADLGLEKAGVALENGFIKIDDHCRTCVPNIYAIGDVTGKLQLAHVASRQATVAAHNITGTPDTEDYSVVPSAVYTHPEIASVGLTEPDARKKYQNIKTARFPMTASGMALAYGQTTGFVKIIADEDDAVIGAHIICPHAADLAQQIALLMKSECTLHELVATIHGHPTFSEALAETAEIILGHPLHSL